MQNSELYWHCVIVPLTNESRVQIDHEDIDTSTKVDFIRFPADIYGRFWGDGLFDRINGACSTLIDDYEFEEIQYEKLPCVIREIDRIIGEPGNGWAQQWLQGFK